MFLAEVVIAIALTLCLYTYVGYPLILTILSGSRRSRSVQPPGRSFRAWPQIGIVIPVYNEAAIIANTLERILAIDYPSDRRQILVVSDASTDATDDIVRGFAARGVDLLRLPERRRTSLDPTSKAKSSSIPMHRRASIRRPSNTLCRPSPIHRSA